MMTQNSFGENEKGVGTDLRLRVGGLTQVLQKIPWVWVHVAQKPIDMCRCSVDFRVVTSCF